MRRFVLACVLMQALSTYWERLPIPVQEGMTVDQVEAVMGKTPYITPLEAIPIDPFPAQYCYSQTDWLGGWRLTFIYFDGNARMSGWRKEYMPFAEEKGLLSDAEDAFRAWWKRP